jgi:predicted MPP superfamily phosphohydrolase
MNISRRAFLGAVGVAGAAAAADALAVEPQRIVVTRHALNSVGSREDDPALRVVQLTDLHLRRVGRHDRRIAETVNRLQPGVLVMTGDMIDRSDRIGELDKFMSLLKPGPVMLATLGNWEHWSRLDLGALAAMYKSHDCQLLVNESVIVSKAHRTAVVSGLDDWTSSKPDLAAALSGIPPHANHIVLAHSPLYRDDLVNLIGRRDEIIANRDFACVLSGHTHGGQVTFLGWAPVLPEGSGRYVSGWYHDAKPPLYVSRGLGTSVAPIRFGSAPEIAVFEWRLAAG